MNAPARPSVSLGSPETALAQCTGLSGSTKESYLILSDIHLGSDLNDHLPEHHVIRRSKSVDADLVQLLHHYRETPPPSGRWHLVIAGDLVDFIGITIRPSGEHLPTALTDEEMAHGLGNTEDHALEKLRRVVERHKDVFVALAAFASQGHPLTIVHGNHDVEFHWDAVKEEFRRAIERFAVEADFIESPEERAALRERITFQPWFFYVGGVAYVEHGHQYDAYCATEHVMTPLCPVDQRRLSRGFSDVLIRYVVRHTAGLREYGHEHTGLLHYVTFGLRLGIRGVFMLLWRFLAAVVALFRLHRDAVSENAKTLRAEHERRMALLAEATRIGLDRLRALAALQTPPITRSIHGILGSVLLDRLALALGTAILLCIVAALGARTGAHAWPMAAVITAWLLAHRYLERVRKIDPAEDMIDRAAHLARLFPAAFVVMGHTHMPAKIPVNDGTATYFNVGSWAEEEEADPTLPIAYRAARTHLVIHVAETGPTAEFLTWSSDTGPRAFSVTKG